MMMVFMRRKVKIISEEKFGRRQNMNEKTVYIFLERPEQDSYVPYSLYPFSVISLMG